MAIPTVFAQVMSVGHREIFRRCIARYGGDAYVKSFSCHDQWLAMAFAQLTHRESLRDLEAALGSRTALLYQMGFRGRVLRSTLADANEQRDWRIYADWAQTLIRRARQLYADDPFAVELDQTVYAFDATVIDLCLTLFPWAHFRLSESAIKLHTLLDRHATQPNSFQNRRRARLIETSRQGLAICTQATRRLSSLVSLEILRPTFRSGFAPLRPVLGEVSFPSGPAVAS
jgi:hypothetical protein